MLYAIQVSVGGHIKFGVSKNVKERLYQLQTGNPHRLYIRAAVDSGDEYELKIHNELKESRAIGEWFKPTQKVMDMVDHMRSQSVPELLDIGSKNRREKPFDRTAYQKEYMRKWRKKRRQSG